VCHTSLIAGLVVSVVDPQPGETIIDCCAAPGGKTLYMASHLSGQGINLSKNLLKSYWISISSEVIINVFLIFFNSKVIVLNMFTHCHCFPKIIQCIPLFLFVNLFLFLGF